MPVVKLQIVILVIVANCHGIIAESGAFGMQIEGENYAGWMRQQQVNWHYTNPSTEAKLLPGKLTVNIGKVTEDVVHLKIKISHDNIERKQFNVDLMRNKLLYSDKEQNEDIYSQEMCIHGQSNEIHQGNDDSLGLALSICENSIVGFIFTKSSVFLVETQRFLNDSLRNKRSTQMHNAQAQIATNPEEIVNYFNLTGDTELDSDETYEEIQEFEESNDVQNDYNDIYNPKKMLAIEQDDEQLGYFYDSAWKTIITKPKTSEKPPPGRHVQRYLELVVAVDDSVIKFHGQRRVKQYVLTLLNIVNAIYQDPSLDARLQVIVRTLHFYEKRRPIVRLGHAKKSLDNVNAWNADLHADYDGDVEPHDVALWLTRMDIGGPSGYAPVGGVCDPKRSCALARDEGLTCAFVIAHEVAHMLGLSHDGNVKVNNTCVDAAQLGSIMAPMVSATFHHFLWSECSREEFASKVPQWDCLLDEPNKSKTIALNSTLTTKFSMDEQCRVEFGEGYTLCTSFVIEPCAHLWCAHIKSPLVCKTKKGPPLEGTECGPNKWCIDGYCDNTLRVHLDPLKYNPQDGGWSLWSSWSPCTRTCGLGIQFRTRQCDNPRPAYDGADCVGEQEEWRVCNVHECVAHHGDFRAQQCVRMPLLLDVPKNYTWLPYESEQRDLKCKFICQTQETGEIYASDENLIDGTPCSYDADNRRCVQGRCVDIGCDHQVNSTLIEDACGDCNGNNSQCLRISSTLRKKIKKQITRLGVIHKQARHVAIELKIYENFEQLPLHIKDINLYFKDRKRKTYNIRRSGVAFNRKLHDVDEKLRSGSENDVHVWQADEDQQEEYGVTTTIMQGAKFRFHGNRIVQNGSQTMTLYFSANGPLLAELIFYMDIKNMHAHALEIQLQSEYLIHKKHKESKYEWIVGGWGSCSQSCGGGRMVKTKACVEKNTQNVVARKLCSIATKPPSEIQVCNNFSCNFVWVPGEWEPCSTTCGKNGVQTREIYCVPQALLESVSKVQNGSNSESSVVTTPWKYMLSPMKCGYQPPPTSRSCARTFCPGHWEFSLWSSCSSCRNGVQIRESVCHPDPKPVDEKSHGVGVSRNDSQSSFDEIETPSFFGKILSDDYFSCGTEIGPKQYQYCSKSSANCRSITPCKADSSVFCSLSSLRRYCRIDSFRELCCRSCNLFQLSPIQI